MPVQQNPMMPFIPPTYNPTPSYTQTRAVSTYQPNLASLGQNNYQTSTITGRIIQNENEIMPNEVAMDGSISLFPISDYSTIIAKQWNANGTISTIKYVPVVDSEDCKDEEPSKLDSLSEQVNKRFDDIERLLTNRNNSNYKKNTGGNNA